MPTGLRLRGRARGGESLDACCPRLRPGLRGVHRVLGLRAFDVQLAAGVVLHQRSSGRAGHRRRQDAHRDSAGFPQRPGGKGVHVTTVNDYLARRDAEWTGADLQGPGPDRRRPAAADARAGPLPRPTAADITYGTGSEFGFDFLRDRLKAASARKARSRRSGRLGRGSARYRRRRPRTCSAATTSPWWTRPTTSSSTRPARRSSSPARPGRPRPRSRSSTTGPTRSPGRWSPTSTSPST